jgi:hypothetical protein
LQQVPVGARVAEKDSVNPLRAKEGKTRHHAWVRRRIVRIGAVVLLLGLVAGLVPFTVTHSNPRPIVRAHCAGVLIESFPEGRSGGWFGYTPTSPVINATGATKATMCGIEARRRAVLPLMATTVVLATLLWIATRGKSAAENA